MRGSIVDGYVTVSKMLFTDLIDLTARVYTTCIPCRTILLIERSGPHYER